MPGGQVFGFEHGASHRYAELANRLFGMESSDAPLPPGFILESDRPEWSYLKRERFFTTGVNPVAAGAAGNFSRLQLINPAKSDMLVVVKGARLTNVAVAGTRAQLTIDGARIGSGIAQNFGLDLRNPVGSGRKVSSQNAIDNTLPAASGLIIDEKTCGAANSDITFDELTSVLPAVLIPNTNLDLVLILAVTAIRAVIWGYERPVTPDELAL